ncbi:MAG: hypothetical protein V3W52_16900 [Syntrophobacteria bacterium]
MDTKNLHITDLFKNFAKVQQELLRDCQSEMWQGVNGRFDRLLAHWSFQTGSSVLRRALLDPYFPLGMLEQTVFADVDGMRFYINKRRLDLEPGLTEELKKWSAAFSGSDSTFRSCLIPRQSLVFPWMVRDTSFPQVNGAHCAGCAVRLAVFHLYRQQVSGIQTTGIPIWLEVQ